MILVETTVLVDLLNGTVNQQTAWLVRNVSRPDLALTDLSFCEVLQGIRTDIAFEKTRERLLLFGVQQTGGIELAFEAAGNYRLLRKRGITVRSTINCLIATYCIRESYHLLHNDRDYDPFEEHLGLKVIHP